MGQRSEFTGGGTVKMRRYVVDEIGALSSAFFRSCCSLRESLASLFAFLIWVFKVIPEITGGGSSSPSAAFLLNCLEKSLACHHSKNFRAKILVGSKILRLDSSLGYNVLGLKMPLRP